MLVPTSKTTLRWLQMTSVKNCHKLNKCKCADDLRRILLKIPINKPDEINIERDIKKRAEKYNSCNWHFGDDFVFK